MPKVSVIIPTFNSEKFVRESLESAVFQTLQDIEIIVVDADSQDNTLKIVEEYSKKDSRIIVLKHPKEYLGASRNAALDIANGDYIMFLDSDDWLEDNACEIAYNQISNNKNDFAYFNVYNYYEHNNSRKVLDYRLKNLLPHKNNNNIRLWEIENFITSAECWYKIYNRDFLNKNNIRFYSDGYSEDINFYLNCVAHSTNISLINIPLLNYRITNSSASTTTANTHWQDQFISRAMAYEFVINCEHSNEYLPTFLPYYINAIISWFRRWEKLKNFPTKDYYNTMKDLFIKLNNQHSEIIENKQSQISEYKFFKQVIKYSWAERISLQQLQKVFSVTNNNNHKIICALGIKIKFKYTNGKEKKKHKNFKKTYKQLSKYYAENLKRIQQKVKNGEKIRVAFYVNDTRWKCAQLFDLMQKSDIYEPFILLAQHAGMDHSYELRSEAEFNAIADYYRNLNMPVYLTHDCKTSTDIPLEEFKPDIIFYLSPWGIRELHDIKTTAKFALSCYIPYFVSNSPAWFETNHEFHNMLWKYFVINKELASEYQKAITCKEVSIVPVGHPVLDEYLENNNFPKKYVIYAPHWSIGEKSLLKYATFDWNGKYILEYAKAHPEFNWIFKPHPNLKGYAIENNLISEKEIEEYYAEWETIGTKYEGPDYIQMFKESKALITDCGSFLAEYMPSKSPVILLRSKRATPYNFLAKKVTKYYYNTWNLKELERNLKMVLESNRDPWKERRLSMLDSLKLVNNAAKNIIDEFNAIFKISKH